jgi:hypothetical protein
VSPPRLAWSLLAAYVGLQMVTPVLVWTGDGGQYDWWFGIVLAGFATVGALVASHHPSNAVGWLLLTAALAIALTAAAEVYGLTSTYPAHLAVVWFAGWVYYVWLVLVGIFLPLVFPTGRLLSARWRPVAWLAVAGLTASIVGAAFKPGELAVSAPVQNPLGASGTAGEVLGLVENLGVMLILLALPLTAVSVVRRLRRAEGVERQQLKWFALACLVTVAGLALAASTAAFDDEAGLVGDLGWSMFVFGFVIAIPTATGIAMLKHRLYDIDVVINRTVVYGGLTVALAASYLASVLVLRLVLSPVTGDSDLAVAGSTLAVAALFRPLRSRIQAIVDRRFYRSRYDAARTLEAFTGRLRDEVDLDALVTDLRDVVKRTVQPTHLSLWQQSKS